MPCAINGCGRPVHTRGYCDSHYKRLLRHGDPLGGGVSRFRFEGPCSVDGCDKPSAKSGLCNAHYLRKRRYGREHAVKRTKPNHCGRPQCRAEKQIYAHLDYLRRPDHFKSAAEKWRQDNPEKAKRRLRAYLDRPEVQERARERTKKWVQMNPERVRENYLAYYKANRGLIRSYGAKYRASRRGATPSWLTPAQIAAIVAIYKEARRLTVETGIRHDVDHIVPLAGKYVCGLHVPWNLRAIPRDDNNRRPRVWIAV